MHSKASVPLPKTPIGIRRLRFPDGNDLATEIGLIMKLSIHSGRTQQALAATMRRADDVLSICSGRSRSQLGFL